MIRKILIYNKFETKTWMLLFIFYFFLINEKAWLLVYCMNFNFKHRIDVLIIMLDTPGIITREDTPFCGPFPQTIMLNVQNYMTLLSPAISSLYISYIQWKKLQCIFNFNIIKFFGHLNFSTCPCSYTLTVSSFFQKKWRTGNTISVI